MALRSKMFSRDGRLKAAMSGQPLSKGSTGEGVARLQAGLIYAGYPMPNSTAGMTQKPDGIFGGETDSAVRGFQRKYGLEVDGYVGPITLGKLDQIVALAPAAPAPCCSTCKKNPGGVGASVAAVRAFEAQSVGAPSATAAPASDPTWEIPTNARFLSETQRSYARRFFKNSLDFSRILITNGLGSEGRPFTIAVRPPVVNHYYVVIHAGSLTPPQNVLIHELAHAWQSQHHPVPVAFMANSVASQGLAMAVEAATGSPASAYAYIPGRFFGMYAAEQIAQQVENGVRDILDMVGRLMPNIPDPANMLSLELPRYEIKGAPGVNI